MNIGIIAHSHTGTTKEFAALIGSELEKSGHRVETTLLQTDPPVKPGEAKGPGPVRITNMPDCARYDVVMIGGPVWGFSATPVVLACLKELKGIKGKKLIPFVTMTFPFTFMGGKRALAQMSRSARDAGAEVLAGIAIPKLFRNYRKDMQTQATMIAAMIRGK